MSAATPGSGGSPRWGGDRVTAVVSTACALVLACWVAYVVHGAQLTAHGHADYGDVWRLIQQFSIPSESASTGEWFALLFQEYKPLDHGHVLMRLAMAAIGTQRPVDYSRLHSLGLIAYAGILFTTWRLASVGRAGRKGTVLLGLGAALFWCRPDEINTVLNNYLMFESWYVLLQLVYLGLFAAWLGGRLSTFALLSGAAVVVVLGDAPGGVAIYATTALAVLATWKGDLSRRRCLIACLPLVAAWALSWALRVLLPASDASAIELAMLADIGGLARWFVSGAAITPVAMP